MLVVRIELWSAITGRVTEIGRMVIANDGTESAPERGNYHVALFRKRRNPKPRDLTSDDRATHIFGNKSPARTGIVIGYARLSNPVWQLVADALGAVGFTPRRK